MQAIAHDPEFARQAGVSQQVGQHFVAADKGRHFADGGDVPIHLAMMFGQSATDADQPWTEAERMVGARFGAASRGPGKAVPFSPNENVKGLDDLRTRQELEQMRREGKPETSFINEHDYQRGGTVRLPLAWWYRAHELGARYDRSAARLRAADATGNPARISAAERAHRLLLHEVGRHFHITKKGS
jgi:hypothetical protein